MRRRLGGLPVTHANGCCPFGMSPTKTLVGVTQLMGGP